MNLHDLQLVHDVLLNVFSFLPLGDLGRVEQANQQFHTLLNDSPSDRVVFLNHVTNLSLIPKINDEDENMFIRNEFIEVLKGENCKQLLKDFYEIPINPYDLNDSDFDSYSNKGGVIDISFCKPCKLLILILKHFRSYMEREKVMIHKFVLFALVDSWQISRSTLFQLGYPDTEISFGYRTRPDSRSVPNFERFTMGRGLLMLLDGFSDKLSKLPSPNIPFSLSVSSGDSVILYTDDIKNAEPCEGWEDIFSSCSNPPYRMENASAEVSSLTSTLYNNGSCESYSWDAYISMWSSYWIAGMEWWGTYGLTTYDYTNERFVIATASTSD